jgi:hypothetical protein
MMRSKQLNFLYMSVLLVFLIMSAFICHADDRARDRASLRGIKTVVVRVHTFEREWASELAKAGLTEAVLKASIERQLEKSGITFVSEEASIKNGSEGILNVRTNFSTPEPPKKSFMIGDEEKLERFDPKKDMFMRSVSTFANWLPCDEIRNKRPTPSPGRPKPWDLSD